MFRPENKLRMSQTKLPSDAEKFSRCIDLENEAKGGCGESTEDDENLCGAETSVRSSALCRPAGPGYHLAERLSSRVLVAADSAMVTALCRNKFHCTTGGVDVKRDEAARLG
jgi:hypothetical protein